MINQHSLDAVDSRKSGIQTVMPLYDSYCFSNLNMLFSNLLGTGAETRMPLQVLGDSPHFFKKIEYFLKTITFAPKRTTPIWVTIYVKIRNFVFFYYKTFCVQMWNKKRWSTPMSMASGPLSFSYRGDGMIVC